MKRNEYIELPFFLTWAFGMVSYMESRDDFSTYCRCAPTSKVADSHLCMPLFFVCEPGQWLTVYDYHIVIQVKKSPVTDSYSTIIIQVGTICKIRKSQGAKLQQNIGFQLRKPPLKSAFPQLFRAFRMEANNLLGMLVSEGSVTYSSAWYNTGFWHF